MTTNKFCRTPKWVNNFPVQYLPISKSQPILKKLQFPILPHPHPNLKEVIKKVPPFAGLAPSGRNECSSLVFPTFYSFPHKHPRVSSRTWKFRTYVYLFGGVGVEKGGGTAEVFSQSPLWTLCSIWIPCIYYKKNYHILCFIYSSPVHWPGLSLIVIQELFMEKTG